jgi:hypothetical protein
MATTKKENKTSDKQEGAGKIKPLKLNKQTVRDLTADELNKVGGGIDRITAGCKVTVPCASNACATAVCNA